MADEQTQIIMAEQQILGYSHAAQGYSLTSLIESMGLTKSEWDAIIANDGIRIPKDVADEIEEMFSAV